MKAFVGLVIAASACANISASAAEVSKDDKVITVLMMQRPCKIWLDEARLKKLRTEMVSSQRGGDMDAKMFSAMHDEAVAASFTIVGDFLARSGMDADTCKIADGYARELQLTK